MTFFKKYYLILAVIILGFILRIWGINFGLPYQFHQDEPIIVNHALAYGSGDFNPHFFNIPPLTSYILSLLYGLYFLIGRIVGVVNSTDDFALSFFKNPSFFYIIGRVALGIALGILCVFLVYILTKNVFSKRVGLSSALVMAVCCLNVINSHYIYVDMLMVLFILLTHISLFTLLKRASLKKYITSAIFLGLATGTKYNAALLGFPFFLTHIFVIIKEKKQYSRIIFSKNLWLSFLTAIFVFILVNPFALLAFREFWASFSQQASAAWHMGWWHHLMYSLKEGISLSVLLFGIIGLVAAALREGKRGILFVSFPLIFYVVLVYYSQPFSRYALPLIPFLAIGFGYFVFEIIGVYCKRRVLKIALVSTSLLLILPTTIKSIKADMLFCTEDTRVVSANWIRNNLPLGSRIACDSTFFRPVLKQPYSQLKNKQSVIKKQPAMIALKEKKLAYMLRASDKGYRGYPVYFLSENPQRQGQFLNTMPAIDFDIDSLRREEIDYVVINYTVTNQIKKSFLRELKKDSILVKRFSPYYNNEINPPYDKFATTCLPIVSEEIHLRKNMGPCLEIYKLKR